MQILILINDTNKNVLTISHDVEYVQISEEGKTIIKVKVTFFNNYYLFMHILCNCGYVITSSDRVWSNRHYT